MQSSATIDRFDALHRGSNTENALIVFLAPGGLIIGQLVIPGGATMVQLPIRNIVGHALQMGASSVMLAHTHPSGNPMPSQRDIGQTHALERILFALSVQIEDHIVLAGDQRFSFRAEGLL